MIMRRIIRVKRKRYWDLRMGKGWQFMKVMLFLGRLKVSGGSLLVINHISRGNFSMGLQFTEFLFFLILCLTIREKLMAFKPQGKDTSNILKMDILMRGCGKKIYSMAMEFRSLGTAINMMGIFCTGTSLGKENMSLQMGIFTKDHSIMVFLMGKEN